MLVANPRKLHAISRHERKSDRRDAQMLARLARVIRHCSTRSNTARPRRSTICWASNCATPWCAPVSTSSTPCASPSRAWVIRVRNPSSQSFHKTVLADVPAECLPVIQPLLTVLAQVTAQIKGMERQLVQRSRRDYPVTQRLQQIAGVGPLTALCFVLKIGDPGRFSRSRDVGAYLGLCPRRDQSGGTDKQLRISKCGDGLLRRLLVSAAHYVLGPFGPNCALRQHGQRLTGTGSARDRPTRVR